MRDLDPLRDWEVQIYVNLWSKTHNISKQLMLIKAIFHCKQFFFLLLEHTCLQAFVSQQLPTCTNPLCVVIFVLFPLLPEFLLYPLKGSECRKFIDKINYFKCLSWWVSSVIVISWWLIDCCDFRFRGSNLRGFGGFRGFDDCISSPSALRGFPSGN